MTEDDEIVIALKLSRAGYGRPDEILKMPTDIVLAALNYEQFVNEYEAEFIELNREDPKK